MIFIPAWITNTLFLVTACVSGYQHMQMKHPNPVTNIQFFMMVFCIVMVLAVAFFNRESPWLSIGFFLTAVVAVGLTIRQNRMLPPMQRL